MNILVTGAAGFIGSSLALRLLQRGDRVLGLDNLNDYYDVSLKEARLARLRACPGFEFEFADITDRERIARLFAQRRFDAVMHLAAQAGVRYSIENPGAYIDTNLVGFANVIEGARRAQVGHFVFASSSSVYGANARLPFAENDNIDHPVSLYAATKKANELIAHSYAHLYRLPCTGLRFFTVYGPWGRPDMALFKFTRGILAGEAIPVFNRGEMVRDFTYVNPSSSNAPYRIYNIGNNQPVKLMRYIEVLEQCLGRKAKLDLLPLQAGDVPQTIADVSRLEAAVGFKPATPIEVGIGRFVEWYRSYYQV